MKNYTYVWQLLDGFRIPVVKKQVPIKYELLIQEKEIVERVIKNIDDAYSKIEKVPDVKIPITVTPVFTDYFEIKVKDMEVELKAPVSIVELMTSASDNLSTIKRALLAVRSYHESLLQEINLRLESYEKALVGDSRADR